jgi:hypothetical protein
MRTQPYLEGGPFQRPLRMMVHIVSNLPDCCHRVDYFVVILGRKNKCCLEVCVVRGQFELF